MTMSERRFCLWCGADLREQMPDGSVRWRVFDHVAPGEPGPVLVESCPICEGTWHRWPKGHPNHAKAEQYVVPPPSLERAAAKWIAANPPGAYPTEPGRQDDLGELQRRIDVLQAQIDARTRVEIDPNVRLRGNQTRTGLKYCHGPVAVGDTVTVYEPEADLEGRGEVTDIDHDKQLVWIRVVWSSLQPKEEKP
jgi:hypothetical protein